MGFPKLSAQWFRVSRVTGSVGFRACLGKRAFSNDSLPPIGFIGLGHMGSRMAKNLLSKGRQAVVFDVSASAVNEAVSLGAIRGQSPSDVAAQTQCVITMLPSSPHVEQVYAGKAGVLEGAQPGSLLIDCSTIDPATSRTVASKAAQSGFHMLDAPVSGGVGGAEAGTLTFMVGGPGEDCDRAKEVLRLMGANIVHCGPSGTGQVAKLCNNLLLAISMSGVAEAMLLGKQLGIDQKVLASIINSSSGRCWSSDTYNPVPGIMPNVPASNHYEGGFGVDLMKKDLGLALDAAASARSPSPLGQLVHAQYKTISELGLGKKDFGFVYEYLKDDVLQKGE